LCTDFFNKYYGNNPYSNSYVEQTDLLESILVNGWSLCEM
jgi:hypothetical protein